LSRSALLLRVRCKAGTIGAGVALIRYRRSTRELEALHFWLEVRPEVRRVERVLEALAHERSIFVVDVDIELADVRSEEVNYLAVIGKLPSRD
jgi:hypothetical protein